jgi:acyl dehydratase
MTFVPPRYDDVTVGIELPELILPIHRVDLVRYAGASGDFNPIHWNPVFAAAVGLPDVIAHGMLTMAMACRVVTQWVGDPGAVIDYGVRFSKPVVVPNEEGTVLRVAGKIIEKLADCRVVVDISAICAGERVLGRARAVVQLK